MGRVPKSRLTLSGEFKKLKQEAAGRTNFSGTGIHFPEPGVVQVEGNLWVTGDFTADGKIDNAALTQPVVPGIGRADDNGFALTTTATEKCGVNLTVPTGTSTLLAVVSARLFMGNANSTGGSDGSGGDAIYVISKLGTQSSVGTATGISGSGGFTTANSTESYVLTGLTPGSTVRLAAYGASAYQAIPNSAGAYVSVCASLIWLR